MNRVAVIIITWNGRLHLEACFRSLALQSFIDFTTIIVDNASTDGTVSWLERQAILPVHIAALSHNSGFAGGNTAGLALSTAEYIVLLNNDTAPEEDWLKELVAAADSRAQRGIIASLLVDWNGIYVDSAGDGLRVTGRAYQRHHGKPIEQAPLSGPVFSGCGGAVLYKRAMIEKVGFLDERFFMNGEDTDLAFRARLAGWEVWFCREAVVRHRGSATQGRGSASSIYYNQRNHIWSITKCMPLCLLVAYAWVHLLEQPSRAIKYARQGCFTPWLRGVCAGIAGIGVMLPDRKRIQLSRRCTIRELAAFFRYPRQLGGRD